MQFFENIPPKFGFWCMRLPMKDGKVDMPAFEAMVDAYMAAGIRFLPMYFPVLLGACLLGVRFGAFVGVTSPLVSYFLTSAVGNAMPAAERLPFMMAELLVFALVAGTFAEKIETNRYVVFPAVLLAALCGRSVFLLTTLLFPWAAPVTMAESWQQICAGVPGLVLQFLLVPALTILLYLLLHREKGND